MSVLSTANFTYHIARGELSASIQSVGLTSFPVTVEVESVRTGRRVVYFFDTETAERCDWWDGEEAHYKVGANDADIKATRLVLFHGNS